MEQLDGMRRDGAQNARNHAARDRVKGGPGRDEARGGDILKAPATGGLVGHREQPTKNGIGRSTLGSSSCTTWAGSAAAALAETRPAWSTWSTYEIRAVTDNGRRFFFWMLTYVMAARMLRPRSKCLPVALVLGPQALRAGRPTGTRPTAAVWTRFAVSKTGLASQTISVDLLTVQ